jgi:hypothetical protein
VPGGRAGRGARATQRRLAAALATEAATPGGRTGLGSRATPYVPTGEPPMLMARLVCPRQSPWSASGGVFARKKLFDGGIRSAGLSHLSSVGSSGPVGHTVYDEALLERRQIDSVGSCAAVTSKCPCVIYWNAEKIRYWVLVENENKECYIAIYILSFYNIFRLIYFTMVITSLIYYKNLILIILEICKGGSEILVTAWHGTTTEPVRDFFSIKLMARWAAPCALTFFFN